MLSQPVLLCFENEQESAARIAQAARYPLVRIDRHRFPDGEIKLRLPPSLPDHVVILRTLNDPNEKLVELLLAAQTARELDARHLTLVAPYLGYMRQDVAFEPGEAISQRIVGQFLASLFDAVITVDPHLHRVATLQQAVPVANAVVLSAAPLLSDLIATHCPQAMLVGPDEESKQWVAQAAMRHGFDYAVCHKVRHGDRAVEIALPDLPVAGRQVVLLDDVVSTGNTLAQATRQLLAAGAASVDVAVTHALFVADAWSMILNAGVREVWSTDCVKHASNAVSMSGPIGEALIRIDAMTTTR
ncbi:MAG: ribose-phosphate pyrophosphokinase [Gammaproteobacteria bacterium]|uniref:ribose-phosphate pyrophosphokinase n=1 Tax=Rhodoferax sp. TaxID=50421 RepID=UPI0017993DC4|nr:ribose-phosphate pyrophosphokinase [Rhodoferax sp.]MBU3899622.1 ribose-phosphate pyrophosphokinase [Gammaproteobacteria bacterium]MBA3056578.1 ribose-phosphate pyrophosphokinase [Rhodoferax sp.]MBU3998953.1 ribose-phosphate pyrophosphokinase [Gammaproteobacteria bacterium]MBU4018098.1 ribose-phosphate pyrophosphokinase [Gammaproteobacteria bacterium]MBU4080211.1 ribose-phosphate pyrophosphokinase [Gammaproteobacteria bacterium]